MSSVFFQEQNRGDTLPSEATASVTVSGDSNPSDATETRKARLPTVERRTSDTTRRWVADDLSRHMIRGR